VRWADPFVTCGPVFSLFVGKKSHFTIFVFYCHKDCRVTRRISFRFYLLVAFSAF